MLVAPGTAAFAAPLTVHAAVAERSSLELAPDGYISSVTIRMILDQEYLPWNSSGQYSVTMTVDAVELLEYSQGNTVQTKHTVSPTLPGLEYTFIVVNNGVREEHPVTLNADGTLVVDGLGEGVNIVGIEVSYANPNGLTARGTTSETVEVGTTPPPVAVDDESSALQGEPQSVDPLANDSAGSDDLQLEPDSLALLDANGEQTNTVTVPGEGVYTVEHRRIVFTPEPGFTGTATPVQYQVTDVLSRDWATASYTPTVIPVVPTAVADESTGSQAEPQSVDPLANDSAGAESAPLDPGSLTLLDADGAPTTTVTVPGEGVYTLEDGVIVFTPEPSFSGTATPVEYRVTDSLGNAVTSSYTPTVTVPAPVAAPEAPAPDAAGSTPGTAAPDAPGPGAADPAVTSVGSPASSQDAGAPPAALATTGGDSLSPLHGWIVALFGGGVAALIWGGRNRRAVRQTRDV
ncbi:hypothetical protein NS354_07815 [Leucobacter chromiiresistens]|uniref:CshA domain-containing protein n=1 Tax=Leucobacter chromiiresistens TaxID=1079994 RepID=A0A147EN51_9MICO|nr:hypothetical protein NS354_07815 [Leucobacter chromiiresistens]